MTQQAIRAVSTLFRAALSPISESLEARGLSVTLTAVKPITIAEQESGSIAGEDEPALSTGTTLFVKNRAFSTTVERLTQDFRNVPGFSFARVQTKPDPKRPTVSGTEPPRLSMGYDFVGFITGEDVKRGMKGMQGFVLDGYALHVKFAGRGTGDEPNDKVDANLKSTSTKECTVRSYEEGYQFESCSGHAHGHPKFHSWSSSPVTTHEAENAYAALRHTHLLGRYLVPEWAEEIEQDRDIEVPRKKAWSMVTLIRVNGVFFPIPRVASLFPHFPLGESLRHFVPAREKFVVIQWTLDAIMYVYQRMGCSKAANAHTQATVEIMEK
ncbi:hypothetical protein K503DRAFT_781786 [Rhizopogon vinicolor AM-OR11-026]|uniref:RRM domain-containing protein n=1 Tax=Rhizopogon vinicolor AM-OR11-026 TaxID=1314800 RepID=A0A1B7N4Z9_9AGAM|nr:hypothetical protein K503DRAFT_781786 [Rhizopogon vinicolor AM-OR11-026]